MSESLKNYKNELANEVERILAENPALAIALISVSMASSDGSERFIVGLFGDFEQLKSELPTTFKGYDVNYEGMDEIFAL